MTLQPHNQRSWLSYIRHELSTPINAIIGYSNLLLEEIEDLEGENYEQEKVFLKVIKTQGEQIFALVKKILATERLELVESEAFEFKSWFQNLLQESETAIKEIINSCDQVLPIISEMFKPDILKIRKAVNNLLMMMTNLVIYQSPALPEDQEFEHIVAQELLPSLPRVKIDQSNFPTNISKPIARKALKGHILIVDDNENNRDLLSRYVQDEGLTVDKASNGAQAITMIQKGNYDLMLLDLIMPEMDGYEVLLWLHSSEWHYIPVIMISALDELDSVVKCIQMGAEDYLHKPFNPTLLRARIGASLEKKQLRDQEVLYLKKLDQANQEITALNKQLKADNIRMSAELEVSKKIQEMILPKEEEINQIHQLDIATYMEAANEVGGDYYDILQNHNRFKIGIGDVTGHGLESGILMLMVQTAVRTLIETNQKDPRQFLDVLNRTIYNNVNRMQLDRNLSLAIFDYDQETQSIVVSGQHENIILVRTNGELETISTVYLGFPIGLELEITDFIATKTLKLEKGDVILLYTDGITESENINDEQYGLKRLCQVVQQNHNLSAEEIKNIVIQDVKNHIGNQSLIDDITLLVLKQK